MHRRLDRLTLKPEPIAEPKAAMRLRRNIVVEANPRGNRCHARRPAVLP
jgi:hypothetical protein